MKADEQQHRQSAFPPSVQAGIPRLGPAPQGWSKVQLGDLLEVIQRPAALNDDGFYQLITARRSRAGLAPRERLRGRDIKVKQQFHVHEGDFVLSNRQIAHGGCGVVPKELDGAIVSNEYTVLKTRPRLDLGFLKHFSSSIYFQQICFHSSVGVHVEKLVFRLEDWSARSINLPPLEEQQRISSALDDWDLAIANTESLARSQRARLVHLLSELSNLDWSPKSLGELGRWKGGGTPDTSIKAYWNGEIPWVSPKDFSSWRLSEAQDHVTPLGVTRSSAAMVSVGSVLLVTRSGILRSRVPVALADAEISINQDVKALTPHGDVDGSVLALVLLIENERLRDSIVKIGTTVESVDFEALKEFEIRLPNSPAAWSVAKEVLGGSMAQVDILTRKAVLLRQQKWALMQKLLTGEWRLSLPTAAAA